MKTTANAALANAVKNGTARLTSRYASDCGCVVDSTTGAHLGTVSHMRLMLVSSNTHLIPANALPELAYMTDGDYSTHVIPCVVAA